MFILPRFFYDDDATDKTGGDTDTGNQQQQVNTEVNLLKPLFTESQLKDFGFDNAEQFQEHLQRHKENRVPDDVKKKNADMEKAEFLQISTEEGLMNVDEYSAYETISKRTDRDLVFEKFATEYKVDNPEATDAIIQEEFNAEYKLDSDKEKVKTRGESRLKKEAEELRSPLSSKHTAAKEYVDNFRVSKKELPAFHKFVDDLVQELMPDTVSLGKAKDDTKDDEDEIDIPATITKEQREEIAKLFKSPKYFNAFMDNKDKLKETLSPSLSKKINSIIKQNNFDSAITYAFKQGKDIGRKRGSNIGAEQLYSAVKGSLGNDKAISQTAMQEVNDSDLALRKKYAGQ